MYNPNASYIENYTKGPNPRFTKNDIFPKVTYPTKPQYSFLGIPLHIPFGVPAGPLLNSAYVRVALNAGFCLPTYKTVRSQSWPSNKWPNILNIKSATSSLFAGSPKNVTGIPMTHADYNRKNLSISNSFGVPSQEPQVWQKDFVSLTPYAESEGYQAVLSFQGSRSENASTNEAGEAFYSDIAKTTELAVNCVHKSGFSLLEINLSCPNEANAPLYQDVPSAIRAIKSAHAVLTQVPYIKLIAKIGVLNAEELNVFLSETAGMLHGISSINTISANVLTPARQIALGNGSRTGGVCGALIFEQGVRMTALLAETREKLGFKKEEFGIIGVGGVFSAREFQSYLSAGADVVQAATGMMWNLDLAAEIADALRVPYL